MPAEMLRLQHARGLYKLHLHIMIITGITISPGKPQDHCRPTTMIDSAAHVPHD
jgi:hypothetical protein